MTYQKGDIVWVKHERRKGCMLRHPAIVWDDYFNGIGDFRGIMLTHSTPNVKYDNVLMSANHFEERHEFRFSNTHYVNQIFIKFQNWGPFYFCGRLTGDGIKFIEAQISNSAPVEFEKYKDRIKRLSNGRV